ncbi:dolichyl-phosphate beta-glucosyltransferase [Archangium lansingense]|uniref:dolichyl-phosphate beta-glucosyltransferase n=1 Tax=Archangium lansingense TaxID=2995310 RepID=A0ABT4ADK5_9BACT|nr:dolichyl-phosphate beta-glucosyltransferase [Archangium lansinium]MCY1078999.1 glycosyltransferase family 2 protein [Archangium lansinium]
MSTITVSVVIPAYNEGERLPPYLGQLVQEGIRNPSPAVEIIVSDDGSKPEHAERHRACVAAAQSMLSRAGSPHRVSYVAAERNGGKGSAIRRGWRNVAPETTWLAFVDADGSVGAVDFFRLAALAASSSDVDVLAGSRILMAGRQVKRNLFRHLQGRVFATFTDLQFQLHYYDTQCGVKFFRASLLRPLLPVLKEERWLLDVELLALMKRHNARALEVPIDWAEVEGSKIVPGMDALRMFWGLTQLKHRLARLPDVALTPEVGGETVQLPVREEAPPSSEAPRQKQAS